MSKLAGILSMMMSSGTNGPSIPLSKEDGAAKDAANLEKCRIRYGLKKFEIDGVTVWARDEKNAIRKAKNGQK